LGKFNGLHVLIFKSKLHFNDCAAAAIVSCFVTEKPSRTFMSPRKKSLRTHLETQPERQIAGREVLLLAQSSL